MSTLRSLAWRFLRLWTRPPLHPPPILGRASALAIHGLRRPLAAFGPRIVPASSLHTNVWLTSPFSPNDNHRNFAPAGVSPNLSTLTPSHKHGYTLTFWGLPQPKQYTTEVSTHVRELSESRVKPKAFTSPIAGSAFRPTVGLSFSLSDSPASKLGTIASPQPAPLSPTAIQEFKSAARAHYYRLDRVAHVLSTLHRFYPESIRVQSRAKSNGAYELHVRLPKAVTAETVNGWLQTMGISPEADRFSIIEEAPVPPQRRSSPRLGQDSFKSNPSTARSSTTNEESTMAISDFLREIDALIQEDRLFGNKPAVRIK